MVREDCGIRMHRAAIPCVSRYGHPVIEAGHSPVPHHATLLVESSDAQVHQVHTTWLMLGRMKWIDRAVNRAFLMTAFVDTVVASTSKDDCWPWILDPLPGH